MSRKKNIQSEIESSKIFYILMLFYRRFCFKLMDDKTRQLLHSNDLMKKAL